ncbi:hypothetical protein BU24DRAFT_214811 [Aaosphaeria arxii CBS 175.79]|uniref:Transmembrane protein n=1 Tax=Aaosphaeria arxii CBS 175.79 TaxID=1450172 RepID=A0A6A5XMJ7_9PLEO|nr:uncharacterized protein BU24DRAFT_214811 [Aaosphaeria arxii CBS 175.79]KAF2014468.1 hypothetical protein BU24DRAFT_214811 [Aaosphaeria arxii CBS 175.79]
MGTGLTSTCPPFRNNKSTMHKQLISHLFYKRKGRVVGCVNANLHDKGYLTRNTIALFSFFCFLPLLALFSSYFLVFPGDVKSLNSHYLLTLSCPALSSSLSLRPDP